MTTNKVAKTHSTIPTKILHALSLFFFVCCFLSFVQLAHEYYWYWVGPFVTDSITEIESNCIEEKNEGRIVHCEGEITVMETLRDPLYNVEIKGVCLYRYVDTTQKSLSAYLVSMEYRVDESKCKLGVFGIKNLNKDTEIYATDKILLTEDNIPEGLKDCATVKDGNIHIVESDGTKSVVSFWAMCAEPRLRGKFLGRQHGGTIDILYFSTNPGNRPKELYYYLRGPMRTPLDAIMRISFAFTLALASAFGALFIINKLLGKLQLKNKKSELFILALLLTMVAFMLEFQRFLTIHMERLNLIKARCCYLYCENGISICLILTFFLLIHLIIRRIIGTRKITQ